MCIRDRGKLAPEGCSVVRLTEETDMTTSSGLNYAKAMIRAESGKSIMLWGAIPCTGGSSWQHVKEALFRKTQNHDALERLRGLREKFR
eukprot:5786009-Prorocentrum_lima.AAC.1